MIFELNGLESLLPKYTDRLSNKMIKVCKKRFPKMKKSYKVLPTTPFKRDGDLFIRDFMFLVLISNLNKIINFNYFGSYILRINNELRYMKTVVKNATDDELIGSRDDKDKLAELVKSIPKGVYHKNHHSDKLARIGIKMISLCGVLNFNAFKALSNLNKEWLKYHQNK